MYPIISAVLKCRLLLHVCMNIPKVLVYVPRIDQNQHNCLEMGQNIYINYMWLSYDTEFYDERSPKIYCVHNMLMQQYVMRTLVQPPLTPAAVLLFTNWIQRDLSVWKLKNLTSLCNVRNKTQMFTYTRIMLQQFVKVAVVPRLS